MGTYTQWWGGHDRLAHCTDRSGSNSAYRWGEWQGSTKRNSGLSHPVCATYSCRQQTSKMSILCQFMQFAALFLITINTCGLTEKKLLVVAYLLIQKGKRNAKKQVKRCHTVWISQINQSRLRNGEYHHLISNLRLTSGTHNDEFFKYFRMKEESFDSVHEKLTQIAEEEHQLEDVNWFQRKACTDSQVCTASWTLTLGTQMTYWLSNVNKQEHMLNFAHWLGKTADRCFHVNLCTVFWSYNKKQYFLRCVASILHVNLHDLYFHPVHHLHPPSHLQHQHKHQGDQTEEWAVVLACCTPKFGHNGLCFIHSYAHVFWNVIHNALLVCGEKTHLEVAYTNISTYRKEHPVSGEKTQTVEETFLCATCSWLTHSFFIVFWQLTFLMWLWKELQWRNCFPHFSHVKHLLVPGWCWMAMCWRRTSACEKNLPYALQQCSVLDDILLHLGWPNGTSSLLDGSSSSTGWLWPSIPCFLMCWLAEGNAWKHFGQLQKKTQAGCISAVCFLKPVAVLKGNPQLCGQKLYLLVGDVPGEAAGLDGGAAGGAADVLAFFLVDPLLGILSLLWSEELSSSGSFSGGHTRIKLFSFRVVPCGASTPSSSRLLSCGPSPPCIDFVASLHCMYLMQSSWIASVGGWSFDSTSWINLFNSGPEKCMPLRTHWTFRFLLASTGIQKVLSLSSRSNRKTISHICKDLEQCVVHVDPLEQTATCTWWATENSCAVASINGNWPCSRAAAKAVRVVFFSTRCLARICSACTLLLSMNAAVIFSTVRSSTCSRWATSCDSGFRIDLQLHCKWKHTAINFMVFVLLDLHRTDCRGCICIQYMTNFVLFMVFVLLDLHRTDCLSVSCTNLGEGQIFFLTELHHFIMSEEEGWCQEHLVWT